MPSGLNATGHLGMHGASHGTQVRPRFRQPPGGNQYLGWGQDAHHDSMGMFDTR